jgi:hypothetical protein
MRLGLRPAAESLKEEIRLRLRGTGQEKAAANSQAEAEMWEAFKPIVERLEAEANSKGEEQPAPQLTGLPADVNTALDPDYREPDPGKRLRDGLLWAAEQWMRVIHDTEDGPTANLQAASTPPPNPFALMVLATYALSPIDKRRELITRALGFATRAHDADPGEAQPRDGFLGDVE